MHFRKLKECRELYSLENEYNTVKCCGYKIRECKLIIARRGTGHSQIEPPYK